MKLLQKLTMKPKIFQRTLGLNIAQFHTFVTRIEPLWKQAEESRKNREDRQRRIGGGRPYNLETIQEMLATILLYYKTYSTQEFIGLLIGIDQSNVSRLIQKMSALIEQAADPELATYLIKAKAENSQVLPHQRIGDWNTFLIHYPDMKEIAIDATEQPCHRSQDYDTQKAHYSGKRKQHTLKTQITVSRTGRIIDVSTTVPGSVHDKTLIDLANTIEKIPQKTVQRMDSGYQGVMAEHPDSYIVLPHKKPKNQDLSSLAKELNRANSRRRVIVENVLSRIKKFKICTYRYRGDIQKYNAIFRNVAAIINFRLFTRTVMA